MVRSERIIVLGSFYLRELSSSPLLFLEKIPMPLHFFSVNEEEKILTYE